MMLSSELGEFWVKALGLGRIVRSSGQRSWLVIGAPYSDHDVGARCHACPKPAPVIAKQASTHRLAWRGLDTVLSDAPVPT